MDTILEMHLEKNLVSLFAAVSAAALAEAALRVNSYSDLSCQNYLGSYWPRSCDALPQLDGGIGSWLIVCEDGNSCMALSSIAAMAEAVQKNTL
jgi:hypothetical protein